MNKKNDFKDFMFSEGVTPPKVLSEKIYKMVDSDLNPSAWKVFTKLTFIHFISAALTLSVCPQFGFRLFGSGTGLMGHFMHFGHFGCMIACGAFFLGSSLLIANFSLKIEEIKIIRKYRWVQIAALISMSLGFFIMLDTEIVFGFAAAWILGSVIGALSVLELGWYVRRKVIV
ncbi:MAG: hypothetical protein JNM93_03985 [Bacteriovoracaceae bacterium]|nr:hypothetical protein [Bacteriovoracaceae bacterium]